MESILTPTTSSDDSFAVLPRNCDTAVVYWNVAHSRVPMLDGGRLCLHVCGQETGAEETIYLHRISGHFIVPILAEDREYQVTLGWSIPQGFCQLYQQRLRLPELHHAAVGAMSSALNYRGAQFWPRSEASVN